MRIEKRRFIYRRDINKAIIEDDKLGLFLTDSNLESIDKLGFEEYQLLDFSQNGKVVLLNSKEWLIRRNTNKTWFKAVDITSNETLFKTDNYLAYRSIIDSTSSMCLLEYYNGLCSIDLKSGETIYKKNKIDKSLYNADIHYSSNKVFIPTEKNSLLIFDFAKNNLEDVKLGKTSATTWVKFNTLQTNILVSDKKNALHCFEFNSFQKPIWTIDFDKYETDNRIWAYEIVTTESNLGCIHGFMPRPDQNAHCDGTLYIFDILTGEVLERFDYSGICQKIITDIQFDKIVLDNLTIFSLKTKLFSRTNMSDLIEQY